MLPDGVTCKADWSFFHDPAQDVLRHRRLDGLILNVQRPFFVLLISFSLDRVDSDFRPALA